MKESAAGWWLMMWWWSGFYFAGRFIPLDWTSSAAAGAAAFLLWHAVARRPGRESFPTRYSGLQVRARHALLVCITGLIFCQYGTTVRPYERKALDYARTAGKEEARSQAVRHLRLHVRKVLDNRGLSSAARGFLAALILADRSALDPEIRERWRRLGIAHFLALSGLHLGIIVLPLYRLLALARLRGAPREAAVVTIVSLYAAIAGAPLSLLRAMALLCLVRLHRLCARKIWHDEALCAGAFMVCLFEPRAASDPGFLLSVSATAGVILVGLPAALLLRDDKTGRTEKVARWTAAALCVSMSAYLFTLPLSTRIFGRAPLAGPFLSVMIAPLFTALLYAGFFYIAGGHLLGGVASRALNLIVEAVAAIPHRVSPLGGRGIMCNDFNPYCYAAGLVMITVALARGAKRIAIFLAGLTIIAASFSPLSRIGRSTQQAVCDTVAAGAYLIGHDRLMIIEGSLPSSRALYIARCLWRRGIKRVEWTVVLDAGCASHFGTVTLDELCELRRILISPWLLMCGGLEGKTIAGKLVPVNEPVRIDTGHGEYLVRPPLAPPGSQAAVAVAEAALGISALD